MRVYFETPPDDRALARINNAFTLYAPESIQIVDNRDNADLVIIHVVGRHDRVLSLAEHLANEGKKFAVLQHALRRTLKPSTESWLPLWQKAEVVVSFLNLPVLCREDQELANFNFYYTPLGADAAIFKPTNVEKKFIIATSGPDYLTEGVREAVKAARKVGRPVFHVGRELHLGEDVECSKGISDNLLAEHYSACEFVSGLRRFEGFELPAAEGFLCGARPIMFDRPHYRAWFNEFAVFIPENSRAEVIDSLEVIFRNGARPITPSEINLAKERFNWERIASGFWERL